MIAFLDPQEAMDRYEHLVSGIVSRQLENIRAEEPVAVVRPFMVK